MIELKNITKKFHNKKTTTALSNVSLRSLKGDIFGVVGVSGAGKSTLIRCVNLLERPDFGEVLVAGKSLINLSSRQLAKERRDIGMIFQHFNLLSSRTVFENVSFPLELDSLCFSEIRKKVLDLLNLVGLEDKAEVYPSELSGGQKQRVAIARALARNPKILLCDEATSALDPLSTKSILNLLKTINEKFNLTILLITHEMDVVKSICNKVAVMHKGELIEQGTREEIFSCSKNQITKQFIDASLSIEIPSIYKKQLHLTHQPTLKLLLKLKINQKSTFETALSQAVELFKVNIKIINAQIDYLERGSFGVMLVEVASDVKNHQEIIDFFTNKCIKVEQIGYV